MRSIRWLFLAVLAQGCGCGGPKVGEPCTWPACKDEKTALRCDIGKYEAVGCPGPKGCFVETTSSLVIFWCDLRGTMPGDPCGNGMQGFVACESATAALVCNSVEWVRMNCRVDCVTSNPDGQGGACG